MISCALPFEIKSLWKYIDIVINKSGVIIAFHDGPNKETNQVGILECSHDDIVDFCQKVIQTLEDYDPTPCCYQHGVGAVGTNEPCPKIADND